MKKIIRNREQGAVAPLVGILMVAFILCLALVVDLGHLHNVKIQLQRAVDAAALAGAQQLDGSDQATHPEAVARATADINRVDGETDWEDNTNVIVELGLWNPDLSAVPRFTSVAPGAENSANAIRVAATVDVEYYFFLFGKGSSVTADAIAVNIFEEPTIPITVVSCIPSGGGTFPGVLSPGENVDEIALYTFGAAPEDTAAWSSLTIKNANSNNLDEFFNDCGTRLFNKIIYGTNETHSGIENEGVKKGGCSTDDNLISVKDFDDLCNEPTDITCGLGADFTSGNPVDPLSFDPLPRWDDFAAIQRIWSMDGVLTQGVGESDADYATRLGRLYKASDLADAAYDYDAYNAAYPGKTVSVGLQDERFTQYIDPQKEKDLATVTGTALFQEPLKEAGYPSVWLIEGETNTIVDFLKRVVPTEGKKLAGSQFKTNLLYDNEPFDEANKDDSHGLGETVQLTIPVIFTGECTEAKYNKPGLYIGTANLLLTRVWRTINECYDAGETAVELQSGADFSRFGSSKKKFLLPGLVGDKLLCTKGFAGKSFEGLIRTPGGDDEAKAGIQKIYLVE